MTTENSLPDSHPLVAAWRDFKKTSAYKAASGNCYNSWQAVHFLWPIYQAGWDAACLRQRSLGGRDLGGGGVAMLVLIAIVVAAVGVGFAIGRLV